MSTVGKEETARQLRQALDAAPVADDRPLATPTRYFRWKGALDRALAAALLAPGLPMILLLTLLVRCTSRGPGIYRQRRVGKDGRTYWLYKIRTMRVDAEAGTGPVWTQQRDPRITLLGRVLRKTHLDELPQLFNVVLGQMSLIGPRPERPEFVHVLSEQIADYRDRLIVTPGITGLAQINLPPDSDLDSVRRKLALDLQYIGEASLLLDLRILAATFVRLLGMPGTLAMRVFGLVRTVEEVGFPRLAVIRGKGRNSDGHNGANHGGPSAVTPRRILDESNDAAALRPDAPRPHRSKRGRRPRPRPR